MNQIELTAAVERRPDKVSGAWVFRGTRVPVTALLENVDDGATLNQFLSWFPGASRTHAEIVLAHYLAGSIGLLAA